MKKVECIVPSIEIIESVVASPFLAGSGEVDIDDFNSDGSRGDGDELDNTEIDFGGDGLDMQ